MHAAGVRGVRVNVASVGAADPDAADAALRAPAGRVAPVGWHVALHAGLDVITALAATIGRLARADRDRPLRARRARRGDRAGGLRPLRDLAAAGHANVKLSA